MAGVIIVPTTYNPLGWILLLSNMGSDLEVFSHNPGAIKLDDPLYVEGTHSCPCM